MALLTYTGWPCALDALRYFSATATPSEALLLHVVHAPAADTISHHNKSEIEEPNRPVEDYVIPAGHS